MKEVIDLSSKRAIRRRSCQGKKCFTTGEEAQIAAKTASWRTKQLILAYPCQFGGHWHVGHPTRSARQGYYAKRGRF